jgi:hypothetical protein
MRGERSLTAVSSYRRRIRLTSAPGRVEGGLEDDFHHFRVTLEHDGERVTSVVGGAVRYPWTTCADAAGQLDGLVGAPLAERATDIAGVLPARENCTHLYDLAGLALRHARAGRATRQYDIEVPDRVEGVTAARLWVDGLLALRWKVRDQMIEDPPPFAGRPLRGAFLRWANETFDADDAEAAIVLRRALAIAMGRNFGLDNLATAADVGDFMAGSCYTFQTERMPVSFRMPGANRDFTDRPDALLTE